MQDRRMLAVGAAVAFLVLAAVGLMVLVPRWQAAGLDALANRVLGRSLTAAGGAHLDFAPLSIRLDDARLSGRTSDDDSLITAGEAVIPVTLGQLFTGPAEPSAVSLSNAELALVLNADGDASWDFPGLALAQPLKITLVQSRLRFFDARVGQTMTLGQIDGVLDIRADGGAAFAGTAVINGRLVEIDADLKSLARVNADGSPLELALTSSEGSGTFSGRLATAQVLSLAGPVSLSGDKPGPALRLLGLPLPEAADLPGPITVDGALDTAGRAYAIRNATLSVGSFHAVGDVVADLREERPKLQANLTTDTIWLDRFMPAAGAAGGDWGRASLPFALLRSFDAELHVASRSLSYGAVKLGGSSLDLTLKDGKLDTAITSDVGETGSLDVRLTADASASPPAVTLSLDAEDTPLQPLLGELTGARLLTGTGRFTADLQATGTTQEEMIGTLKGSATIAIANGRVAGVDLAGLFLAARRNILEGWSAAPGGTDFENLNGEATIADGILTLRDLRMEAPALEVTLEGIVDLLRQGVEVSASASSNGQPLLPVPVVARGLWAKPKIFPDVPDILTDPKGGFAKLEDLSPLKGN